MNPILEKITGLYNEGLSISAVSITKRSCGKWRIAVSINSFFPLGEGGELPHHAVKIDTNNMPHGVACSGRERHPDETFEVQASEEGIECLLQEVAKTGYAVDLARHDGAGPDYPHFLTKPAKWNRALNSVCQQTRGEK